MQANRGKDTKPELLVRAALRTAGLTGYRLHWRKAPGRPDVCFVGRRVAILVNGCFWHRCPYCALPSPRSHPEFWRAKFARNRQRDREDLRALVSAGWTVLVVWECRLRGARAQATLGELVGLVRELRQGPARPLGRVIEVGSLGAVRLAAIRARRLRRR